MGSPSEGTESLARRTRRLLRERGLAPLKSKGQHFLVDQHCAAQIADFAAPDPSLPVLEIGAGLGALTLELAARAPHVVAVELDRGLLAALRSEGLPPTVTAVEGDALELDLEALLASHPGRWRATGNLPYYAATAILQRLLLLGSRLERIVATVQSEVAERLRARPGDPQYGSLSVWTALHAAEVAALLEVPRGAFYPQPKVDSQVVCLTPREGVPCRPEAQALLLAVVRAAFGQRRKMLRNALAELLGRTPSAQERLAAAMAQAGIAPQARGEAASPEQFVVLAEALASSEVELTGSDG